MKKLLPFLLAAFLPFSAQAQRQAITVEPNGTGAGTVSTAGITYYYMGANTYDFTGSILVNGTLVASATAVYYQVSQANSFVAGQPVTVNGSGTWVGAFANGTLAQANAVGVVSSTGLSAGAFQVVIDGICPIGGSALTTGSIYYVPLSAGIVTSTAPSVAGQYVYPLATAISPSILVVSISTPSIVNSFAVSLSGNNVWTGTNQFNNRVEIGPNGTSATSWFSVDPAITVPGGVSSNMVQITGVGTVSGNSYATTGLLIQPNFTLGAFTGGNVNFVDIEAGGSTTGTPASGYMLKVGGPLSGMTGAFDVVSGAVNLGSGLISTGGGGFAIGTTPSSTTSLIVKQISDDNIGAAQFMRSGNSHYFGFYMGGDDNAYFDARTGGASKIEFYSNSGSQQAEIDPGFGLRLFANGGAVGNLSVAGTATVTGATTLTGATTFGAAFGYLTGGGLGGTVTQGTSRTTAVTLSKLTGAITLFSAAGSATPATFTVNNTTILAGDTIEFSQVSGTNQYHFECTAITGGTSFNVTFYSMVGTATDAPVVNFKIIRGSTT